MTSEMAMLSDDTKICLRNFYFGRLPPEAFLDWLCANQALEVELGAEEYCEVLWLDFLKPESVNMARQRIKEVYNRGWHRDLITYDYVEIVLKEMLSGSLRLDMGCTILSDLSLSGHEFIPLVFVGYRSELDDDPSLIDFYRDRMIDSTREFLLVLSKAKSEGT